MARVQLRRLDQRQQRDMVWVFLRQSAYLAPLRAHLDHAAAQLHADSVIVRCAQRHLPPPMLAFRAPCCLLRRDVVPVVLMVSSVQQALSLGQREEAVEGTDRRAGSETELVRPERPCGRFPLVRKAVHDRLELSSVHLRKA